MKYLLLPLLLFLGSCSAIETLMPQAREASDAALAGAIDLICTISPVGAVKRRFDTPAEMKTYNDLCKNTGKLKNSDSAR